jgi:NADPH-dependent 2,4-dienoyl-CoA reductase/sulfur reductase-like enzyme/rhodanese-related sulfurtransferase
MAVEKKRILIVGGVAGGASCAARARRLSETAEILMFERGEYVSFANCGLPYYVGDVIRKEEDLLVATPELFREWFNIEVRLQSEVVAINSNGQTISVKDLRSGSVCEEFYDALVLSPGASAIRPDLPGIDLPGIFSLRTIPDSRRIREWIDRSQAKRALIVGGGYIGMEMTENLVRRGLTVTVVEMESQLMPLLDPEMAFSINKVLAAQDVRLRLNETVTGFAAGAGDSLRVQLASGAEEPADLVLLCIGVQPETRLARAAGLEIGERGGIRVDVRMQTSNPHIWAVGDAIEVKDAVTDQYGVVPLAGPANRQGRTAADVIMGREAAFHGVLGTSVVGIFGSVIAFTGPSEKTLRRLGLWKGNGGHFEKVYLHPRHHAGYYPGANPISLKLIFRRDDGRIVSAQAFGKEGVERRIDVISMAIQKGGTVFDLEEAELCYAPQFGSAKDPVNMAGMIAANVIRGDVRIVHWEDLEHSSALILDVRDLSEFKKGSVPGATHIPIDELRRRMIELPRDRDIWAYCFVGQRSYYASRALQQYGYRIKNISGGYKTFLQSRPAAGPRLKSNPKEG